VTAGVLVALGTVYVVWGSTYLGIKYAVDSLPPFLAMGIRFLLAGAVLLVALLVLRGPSVFRMTRSQLVTAALCGLFLLVGGNGLVAVAEQDVDSSLAALLVAGTPLWVVLLRAILRDRPSAATVLGLSRLAAVVRRHGARHSPSDAHRSVRHDRRRDGGGWHGPGGPRLARR
jgi:drug/metabolite transporter (DMT)-like permease